MPQKLIRYPFKVQSIEDVILYKSDKNFEMRFTRELTSRKIISENKKDTTNYIEIEIDEHNNAKIVNSYDSLAVFKTAADFYIPISENAKYFYESLHSALTNDNLDSFLEKAKEIDETIRNHGFPEFPIPIVTNASHFENFEQATATTHDQITIPTVQVKYSDPIPDSVSENVLKGAENSLVSEQFKLQNEFYTSYFESNKITRFKNIPKIYEKKDINFKRSISVHLLKKCIALHAYFVTSGPWRKCWVKFGFDPKSEKDSYKYQIIEMRSKRTNFQVFQKPEIIYEVSKNSEWYLLPECDPIDGFISKALKNFIIYLIDNGEAKLINKKIEEIQDSDMEIFEM